MNVPGYSAESGVTLEWDHGFSITCTFEDGEATISGNRAGLRSLARHLLVLSQEAVPVGTHIHLDDQNALEPDSIGLVIEVGA